MTQHHRPAAHLPSRRFGDTGWLSRHPQQGHEGHHYPVKRYHETHGHQPFRALPSPTGMLPYRLPLEQVVPIDADATALVFHMVGDTGGVKTPVPQLNVARAMEKDLHSMEAAPPVFFYHLGDVVYFDGEADQYYPQFYDAYANYHAPIMAIPGNHDGDISREMEANHVPSLAAFVDNFCARIAHHTPDARDVERDAMTQPNVYWTLEAPLVTVVGLYTNVPEGGSLDPNQIAWFETELHEAPRDRPLLVAMHHPIYSVDGHHSGSEYLHRILDDAVQQTGRKPDAVFAAHVHNYQRFTRSWQGWEVPFIVAGGGGYHNLHRVLPGVKPGPQGAPEDPVTLETFCDHLYGYLRLEVTKTRLKGAYYTVPGFQDPMTAQGTLFDSFTLDIKKHTLVK